jgi:hypothetical protein
MHFPRLTSINDASQREESSLKQKQILSFLKKFKIALDGVIQIYTFCCFVSEKSVL